jgi:putative ABC transport system substrate-binding protein
LLVQPQLGRSQRAQQPAAVIGFLNPASPTEFAYRVAAFREGLGVAAIAATGGVPSVRAAKTATTGIPIVFTFEGDPVEFGLVASMNRPGGNVTGITMISSQIVPRRIGLLRDVIPGIKTIAVLSPANKAEVAAAEQAAGALGWQVRVLSANGKGDDFDAAFKPLTQERADALRYFVNGQVFRRCGGV